MSGQDKYLQPGERLDDLLLGDLRIIQHPDVLCFGIDAVLLAHFATVKPGVRAVDLGTGTGAIAFLLTVRGAGSVNALELNPRVADMAGRSCRLNMLEEKVRVIEADYRELKGVLPAGESQLVVVNPPYRPLGQGFLNERRTVARACHELTATLEDVAKAAAYLLGDRGRIAMVHRADRLCEVMLALNSFGLEPKRLRFVQSRRDTAPKLLLIEGVRSGKPGIAVEPPLIIYDAVGVYSEEIQSYYRREPVIFTKRKGAPGDGGNIVSVRYSDRQS